MGHDEGAIGDDPSGDDDVWRYVETEFKRYFKDVVIPKECFVVDVVAVGHEGMDAIEGVPRVEMPMVVEVWGGNMLDITGMMGEDGSGEILIYQ